MAAAKGAGMNPDHAERSRQQSLDSYERLIRAEMASRQQQIEEARKENTRQKQLSLEQGQAEPAKRPLVGTGLLPSQYHRMTDLNHFGYMTTAYYWGMAHSWVSNFGLYGHPETEETKMRAMISQTTPPVILLELNSKHTFNMLDPILCTDFMMMMEAYKMHIKKKNQRSTRPLAAVLQGAGPHLCPGGNHHPVAPPGATPWTMCTRASNSVFAILMKEMAIPSVAAVCGNAIGGGVAMSLNCTERVMPQNGSAAFGNISRGACPIMWLSKHLPQHVGLAAAMNVYLTDSTLSPSALQKAGLISQVCSDNKHTKSVALKHARRMASFPSGRLACMVQPVLSLMRFEDEARGLQYCGTTGQMMFPGVEKKTKVMEETAAIGDQDLRRTIRAPGGSRAARRKGDAQQETGASDADVDEATERAEAGRAPQPFPSATGNLRPVHVPEAAAQAGLAQCVQCGSRGGGGTVYRGSLYCDPCWSRVQPAGSSLPATEVPEGLLCARCGDGHDLVRFGSSYQCRMCGPGVGLVSRGAASPHAAFCATCGSAGGPGGSAGKYGAGAYSKDFYCNGCWKKWEAWPAVPEDPPTDIGTDRSNDSGTEGTLIDSDRACFTSGSDMEM